MGEYSEMMEQISCSLKDANFPITSEDELLAAFPCGADTKYMAGEKMLHIGETIKKIQKEQYPFNCSDDAVMTMCDLWKEGSK